MSRMARLAEGSSCDQKHSLLSSTPEGRMLQGSGFECRSGQPGRTLWCLGAPTRTCCGVTQGVKLREQRRRSASLEAERGQGRRGRLKYVKARRARHSEAAKEADRPQPKGDVGRTVGPVSAGGSTRMSHRAIEPSLPTTHLDLDQLGKPHGPRPAGAVGKGETVNLVGFGRFEVYERSARRGRNLRTGESLKIPATKAVRFKVGKRLRDAAAGSKRKRVSTAEGKCIVVAEQRCIRWRDEKGPARGPAHWRSAGLRLAGVLAGRAPPLLALP